MSSPSPAFAIREQDWPLIESAIQFGDWLKRHAAAQDIAKVDRLQDALRRLPETTPALEVEYGFTVRFPFRNGVLYRSWMVTMSANTIEIFSNYTPDPRVDVWEEIDQELAFELTAGKPNFNSDTDYEKWCREVARMDEYMTSGDVEIEIYESGLGRESDRA